MNRFQVWLDGKSLHSIDPSIRIVDVKEHVPVTRTAAASTALGDGQHVTQRTRESLSVTISFVIREYTPCRRKAIMQNIRAWAQGTTMQLNDRIGMRLTVAVESLPTVLSSMKWTDTCTMTFTASEVPYWEESFAATATAASPNITPPGDVPTCPADFTWTADADGPVTLVIQTPLSSITFADLPVTTGQTLTLGHVNGLLTAALDGADVLAFRTPASSDDLLLNCGRRNRTSVTVNGVAAAAYTISARGRWL